MKIINTFIRTSTVLLLSTVISMNASADSVRIGAMKVGSGWYVGAAAIKKMMEKTDSGIDIDILARGGGVANPMVVEQGKAQIAISNVATSQWAMNGELLYNGKKATHIRSLVGGLNPVYIGAIVRNQFMEDNHFSTLKDILESGKPVNILMKPPGSNIPPAVDIILKAHGTSREKIEQNGGRIIQVAPAQMASMIRDRRADIYFDTILRGHPTIQEITLTGGVRFIDISEEGLAALAKVGIQKGSIPKWFDIQTEPVVGGNYGTHLIANSDLPDETAYQITKLVIENMDTLAEDFPAWKFFKPEDAAKPENNGIPLHPGAIRYYKEIGLL
ncbi:hypothetical protein SAMN03080615_01113 [Amphritea atlantica]|uniref:TRAP transporter solute receptor, TAXI family n=1 Tax=Amphritea atlantica TaxID=355243 RepID=A0A1H9EWU9_9GAMM|nr:TAXI family TRAP transporter solute-binding subunit [Amphritea atlantica]SEQ30067.1 hypothetical protein SAMN03080615_01113 [Amphritea atlantica]